MTVVLVGIIGIQYYWIKNAIELKEEEFTRKVNDGLTGIVNLLEKEEAVRKLKSHRQGRMLFLKTDSVDFNNIPDSLTQLTVFNQYDRKGKSAIVDHVEETDEVHLESHVTLDGETVIHDSIIQKFSYQSSEQGAYLAGNIKLELDTLLKKRLINKTVLISDIVKSLMEVNLNEEITDRVNLVELDSLLQQTFNAKGINTNFEFAIFNAAGNLIVTNSKNGKYNFLEYEFTSRLFPEDIIQEANYLNVHFPNQKGFLLRSMGFMLVTSVLFVIGIILIFLYAINTIIKQKQLSEVKNDFINNMTHELKTPISTISLACEALSDKDIAQSEALLNRYIKMIKDENHRLGVQVENVLQSAVWDKGDFKLKKEEILINELVLEVVNKIEIQVKEKQGIIETILDETNPIIMGDKIHLTNVIYNLVDNANKYTKLNPEITISTKSLNQYLVLSITDNGIGISKENQKKIFEKLYRVPTGNVHDVKGFGLGLNYVKTIVDRHNGKVEINSTLGKGSTFEVYLPKTN
jgi:two-component system phosphate regulon sensor histidine kinase PhoR